MTTENTSNSTPVAAPKKSANIYNRAEIIDENFKKFVAEARLPAARVAISPEESFLSSEEIVDLFESQMMSRLLDIRARELKNDNQCFYTIGSSGHEGNAVIGKVFELSDMAFLHYRSGALMAQRAKKLEGSTPLYDAMLSFVASSEDPISGGRHKVFGSLPLNVPPQTSTIASHLPKAVGAALSVGRAKDLNLEGTDLKNNSVVFCTFGDASTNHATAQAAFNTASHISYRNVTLPIVFVCEDNGIGISVPTPEGWIHRAFSQRPEMKYFWADGLNILHSHQVAREAVHYARTRKKPVFLHISTVRLLGHAGSDPEWIYNSLETIESTEFQDPLLHTARICLENGILTSDEILEMYENIRERIRIISNYTVTRPKLTSIKDVKKSVTANLRPRTLPEIPKDEDRSPVFSRDFDKLSATPFHMAKLINFALTDLMIRYKNTVVFGEDVAQKGGVYNVTEGLFKKFGPRRVFNSVLDETSILGNAIGMAHNGFLPIPEIQFLAYVHNAEDQIRGEAATLAFFSKGLFTNPMVIRVAGLAYQKGFGGHFHNDNSLAIFRDIPGLILAVPSNGADAVRMLRTCVKKAQAEGRVVIFVEPIALYMTKDLNTDGDKAWSFNYPAVHEEAPFGEVQCYGENVGDILVITYGNGYYYSRQAEKELKEKLNIKLRIIDLCWLTDFSWDQVMNEVKKHKNVLIVDECRKTGGPSEGIVSGIIERLTNNGHSEAVIPKIQVLAAEDCFIPLGVAAAAGLPKKNEVVAACLGMLKK